MTRPAVSQAFVEAAGATRRLLVALAGEGRAPPPLLAKVRRAALGLTRGVAADEDGLWVRLLTVRPSGARWEAETLRAAGAATLAVAMAKTVTDDEDVARVLAEACLVADVPRAVNVAWTTRRGGGVRGDLPRSSPEVTAAVLATLGGVSPAVRPALAVAYEAQWLRVGPPPAARALYDGLREPTLHGRLVAMAYRYVELLDGEGRGPSSFARAALTLAEENREGEGTVVLRLLVSALGLFLPGTLVELAGGGTAEVVSTGGPREGGRALRLVTDRGGGLVEGHILAELGSAGPTVTHLLSLAGWHEQPRTSENVSARLPSVLPTPSPDDGAEVSVSCELPPAPRTFDVVAPDVEPAMAGTLEGTPLLHLLAHARRHHFSGSLVLVDPEGAESAVAFEGGCPTRVRTARPVALLGEELSARGLLRRDTVRMAVAGAARLGLLFGEYVVGYDLVGREDVERTLTDQLVLRVASLTNEPPETSFAFYTNIDLLGGGSASLPPQPPLPATLAFLVACARVWHDRAHMHAAVARQVRGPTLLRGGDDLTSLELMPAEALALSVLRAGAKGAGAEAALLAEDALPFVYALVVGGDLGGEIPVAASSSPDPMDRLAAAFSPVGPPAPVPTGEPRDR